MRHLNYTEIVRIQTLRKEKRTQEYIGKEVDKDQSSISRFCNIYKEEESPENIWETRKERRRKLNQKLHCRIEPGGHLERYILFRLTGTKGIPLRDSPEQIVQRWKQEQGGSLSKDTIYSYIKDHHRKYISHLRRQGRKYIKKMNPGEEKYQILNRVMIDEREKKYPQCELRSEVGHWELDTIVSSKTRSHGVITAVERMSGFTLTRYVSKKSAWNICDGLRDMFEAIQKEYKKSLTSDNGREFAYHTIVKHETGLDFYFAHPYSPWERGSNENTNGLLRQFLAKKQSFAGLKHSVLQSYTKSLNSRPRKRHNYRTPEEVLFGVQYRLTDLCILI